MTVDNILCKSQINLITPIANRKLPAVVKGVKISINEFHVCLMFTNAFVTCFAKMLCNLWYSAQCETGSKIKKLLYCPTVAYALLCCASV